MSKKLRVIYLSSTPLGIKLLKVLKTLPCEIVFSDTTNTRFTSFPDYDLGISFLYTYKIPETEFITPNKWLNFHPGPLPEMKGRNLAFQAIMEEIEYYGSTLHYMDKDLDTGELIAVRRFKIKPEHTAGDLVQISHSLLSDLFHEYIPKILTGENIKTKKQIGGRYFKKNPIDNYINLSVDQEKLIKALTVHPLYHAKIKISGKDFKIIPSD